MSDETLTDVRRRVGQRVLEMLQLSAAESESVGALASVLRCTHSTLVESVEALSELGLDRNPPQLAGRDVKPGSYRVSLVDAVRCPQCAVPLGLSPGGESGLCPGCRGEFRMFVVAWDRIRHRWDVYHGWTESEPEISAAEVMAPATRFRACVDAVPDHPGGGAAAVWAAGWTMSSDGRVLELLRIPRGRGQGGGSRLTQ